MVALIKVSSYVTLTDERMNVYGKNDIKVMKTMLIMPMRWNTHGCLSSTKQKL